MQKTTAQSTKKSQNKIATCVILKTILDKKNARI